MIFKNGLVLFDGETKKVDIQVEKDKITKIAENLTGEGYDLKGCLVLSGAIDPHAHFREPGFCEKETILSGTKSAIKGGVFTAFAMPNLKPTPDNLANLKIEEDIIKRDAKIKVYPYGAITVGEKGEKLSDIESLANRVIAFSDDGKCVNDLGLLKEGMERCQKVGKIICSHAEAQGYGDSEKAEYIAVERELKLAKETKVKYHFCHMSTYESFELIKAAKRDGVDVTCEVTPHHLTLAASLLRNTNFKMNPPLRSKKNMAATVGALLSGVADMIATDHAPHTTLEKQKSWEMAPYGIIGFETLYPALVTGLYKTGLISLETLERVTSKTAAVRFGLNVPKIAEGENASFCAIDLEQKRKYEIGEIQSKGKNSPYLNMELFGFNKLSLINGKIEYLNTEEICQTKF